MSAFRVGEIVDVHITGARVHAYCETPDDMPEVTIAVESEAGQQLVQLPIGWPNVNVDRAAPQMRHGDVWRDNDKDLWLIQADPCEMDELRAFSAAGCLTPEDLDRHHGPLMLVHREDEQGGGA